MVNLGVIAFASPWLLLALGLLPILWWLLRITPPAPKHIDFPPIRLLLGLLPKEETPAHTPLWLLLLRLFLAALVILGLAQPLLNPGAKLVADGPLVLVIDDGWHAAAKWERRVAQLGELIDQAERARRPVMVLTTAAPVNGDPVQLSKLMPPGEARAMVAALQPKPWASDRRAALKAALDAGLPESGEVIWLGDGIDDGAAFALAERLQWVGALQVLTVPSGDLAKALVAPRLEAQGLKVRAIRASGDEPATLWIRASAEQGRVLAREAVTFAAGDKAAEGTIDLPSELRNRIDRIDIEGEHSAGAVVLIDERWRRRPVGLASGAALESKQPLLSDLYYLERALAPFTEIRQGDVGELMRRELAVLVLADIGQLIGPDRGAVDAWLKRGGVLLRFAGPRLAESGDGLLPVSLRAGSRQLGGAMSWAQPARLAPFPENSPFAGLAIPADVTVNRQVLAEPELDLAAKTWARLADGTPLVTGEKRGQGWLVLVHTTANTQWSNLALSGLFIDMLRRLVDLSQGVAGTDGAERLAPQALLDGSGRLVAPSGAAVPIAAREIADTAPSPRHPPGWYGNEDARRALNIATRLKELAPIARWPEGTVVREIGAQGEIDLMPWLLGAAMALALADLVIAFGLRGLFWRRPRAAGGATLLGAVVFLAIAATGSDASAQATKPINADDYALAASLDLRLVYVLTGVPEVDHMSRAGMVGLNDVLFRRTTVEAADPMGVDLERDDIVFFPFLYWPIVANQRELSDKALARVDNFMKTGGLILFDTRDQGMGGYGTGRGGPGALRLRQLLAKLDVPPLIPAPGDHVLTKSFYLIQEFPGRYAGGQIWVERHPGGTNDGVSSLVIGSHDWAAAWAIGEDGRPLAMVLPGGHLQREMAYRFGINLVMYALTGNYKADQVHVPALLERLGQ